MGSDQGHFARAGKIPEHMRDRVTGNRQFASEKLEALEADVTQMIDQPAADNRLLASPRYAVVTPYYKEDPSLLKRCLESVRADSGGS
jgi:hypothetical protein